MNREEVKILDGEEAREIAYDAFSRTPSPTAANSTNRLYGPSGAMDYRVVVANGSALTAVTIKAATGDDAAAMALARYPGQKVAHVAPTGSEYRPTDDFLGEA